MLTVSFSPSSLSNAVSTNQYIPHLEKFKHIDTFETIKSVYQELGYAPRKIDFTVEETLYLSSSPIIKYTDTNSIPLIFDRNEVNVGIAVDYLVLITRKTGLKFSYQPSSGWQDAKQKIIQEIVDILPLTGDYENTVGLHSIPYEKFQYAVVKRDTGTFVGSLQDLEQDKIVVIKHFNPADLIKSQYPQMRLIEADDIKQALVMLLDGRADAFVEHSAVAWHYVVNYFPSLKVVGMTDDATLIRNRWVEQKQAAKTDYSLIIMITVGFSFMLLLAYFFIRNMMMKNKLIEKSNQRLNSTIDDLNTMQKALRVKHKHYKNKKKILSRYLVTQR
jgi:hypothetical protein